MLWKRHYGDTKILWILKRRTTRIQIATAWRRSSKTRSKPSRPPTVESHKPFFACETLSRINWKFIKFSAFSGILRAKYFHHLLLCWIGLSCQRCWSFCICVIHIPNWRVGAQSPISFCLLFSNSNVFQSCEFVSIVVWKWWRKCVMYLCSVGFCLYDFIATQDIDIKSTNIHNSHSHKYVCSVRHGEERQRVKSHIKLFAAEQRTEKEYAWARWRSSHLFDIVRCMLSDWATGHEKVREKRRTTQNKITENIVSLEVNCCDRIFSLLKWLVFTRTT